MAKKSLDVSELIKQAEKLLGKTKDTITEVRSEVRKRAGCKNHPEKLIYKNGLCTPCYEIYANLLNKKNAEKEPWISTDGYKKIYRDDGSIVGYHRFVMEQHLGRKLLRSETVKFKDLDPLNCAIENLRLTTSDGVICIHCGGIT